MVEFAHPNTHKLFHIGHLRNITTGESISRLLGNLGADIVRANYQGDVGVHIAKAIWGIKKLGFNDPGSVEQRVDFLGKAYSEGNKAYEEDESAKEEINNINKAIYASTLDEETKKIYEETRNWSLQYFDTIYARVYTKFDRLYFESQTFALGKEIALKALDSGILKKSEGAIIFPGSEHGLHDRVFITSQDTPTYEAKDLGLARLQFDEFHPDKILHLVGPEQTGYFEVLIKALELIEPETKGKEFHLPYGWVRLKEGKMSSRAGNVVTGESVLNDAKDNISKNYEVDDNTAEIIAVGAVKYAFLKVGLTQEIAFDLKESISLDGNSGPYLQYTYARCQSVLKRANLQISNFQFPNDFSSNINPNELTILRTLVHYLEAVEEAGRAYSPNLLCNYLYKLSQEFNTFYNANKIIGSDNEKLRLLLTKSVGEIIKSGLNLLGINAPEKM